MKENICEIDWQTLSGAYAFLGNSLLKPMRQTASVGLDPAFWETFPTFDDGAVAQAACALVDYAREAGGPTPEAIQMVSVEYTRLFVGPPSPAAAPWETMYHTENVTVGFGQATFDMRELLRDADLQLSNENNQYEDHMGIELLYLSELCRQRAEGDVCPCASNELVVSFIEQHPLAWIQIFRGRVIENALGGYFDCLLGLVYETLRMIDERLKACH